MANKKLILLYIENNLKCRKTNAEFMRANGINVIETDTTKNANELFLKNNVDFIMIDLNLHQQNRMDFIRFLRQKDISVPIIITACEANKEILLDAINLDTTRYLIKPFDYDTLQEALQAASLKILNTSTLKMTELYEGFQYDPVNKCVIQPDGTSKSLTKKEYLLIELLLKNKQKTIPYEVIEAYVWGEEIASIDALRTLVYNIRKKTYPKFLINNSGIGYKID